MTRQLLSFGSAFGLLALLAPAAAGAVELPVRKAGLWEMKVLRTGSPAPEMTMQHCTDETTDKEMSTAFSPMGKEMCSKQDIVKTATGYVSDSVCGVAGMSITSHAEINGAHASRVNSRVRFVGFSRTVNQRPLSEAHLTPQLPPHKRRKAKGARKSTIPASPI